MILYLAKIFALFPRFGKPDLRRGRLLLLTVLDANFVVGFTRALRVRSHTGAMFSRHCLPVHIVLFKLCTTKALETVRPARSADKSKSPEGSEEIKKDAGEGACRKDRKHSDLEVENRDRSCLASSAPEVGTADAPGPAAVGAVRLPNSGVDPQWVTMISAQQRVIHTPENVGFRFVSVRQKLVS
jgi:hypothetical protein